MEKMRIGDVAVTKLALGAWAIGGGLWWGDNDDKESEATIREAVDCGIELIDTAPAYGFGHSEEVVGRALSGIRDRVKISTKCGIVWGDTEGSFYFTLGDKTVRRNLSAASIMREAENSLRRLNTDHIDLYITHWQSVPPFITPVEETMSALLKLKEQGKILGIGISNATPDILNEYLACGKVDLVQEKFSILDRAAYLSFEDICKDKDVVFQAYSPMELGLLTGKISDDYVPDKDSARAGKDLFEPENIKLVNAMLAKWRPLVQKYDASYAQLAIVWAAAQNYFVNVLCGARTKAQLADNIRAGQLKLEKEDLEFLTKTADEVLQKKV